jgi:RHS repeat-associated protein
LGSAALETNENGQVISYEEYHPFGTSAYRVARSGTDLSLKRYRFTNKERDDETGLYYFGVRYYAAWLGRWTSSDPGGFVDGLNLYVYVRNNPVKLVDEEGYEGVEPPLDDLVDRGESKGTKPEYAVYRGEFDGVEGVVVLLGNDKRGDSNEDEPDRNQAGTIEEAKAQWEQLDKTSPYDLMRYIQSNNNAVRYVYTEEKGWIDLQHYFASMVYSEFAMDRLEYVGGLEIAQDMFLGAGANESTYSYEDLPSNAFASESMSKLRKGTIYIDKEEAETYKVLRSGQNFLDDIEEVFVEIGATIPGNAPNWRQMPYRDHEENSAGKPIRKRLPQRMPGGYVRNGRGKRRVYPYTTEEQKKQLLKTGNYIPQNTTETPYDLSDFAPAPTSLDKGDTRRGATNY